MKRIAIVAVMTMAMLGLTATSAVAGAQPKPNQVAAKICSAEKHADKAAFEATYGEHAMRECKRLHRDEAGDVLANAAQECRAEEEADPVAFVETYGTGPNGKNAFGKCVSSKVGPEAALFAEPFKNAAKECRAERAADPEAFTETYGSNRNGRNAFGKCVSKKVKETEETPVEPTV